MHHLHGADSIGLEYVGEGLVGLLIGQFFEGLPVQRDDVEGSQEELVAAKKELFNLRFQNATNQLDNTSRIKDVRKNIARIQTVLASAE